MDNKSRNTEPKPGKFWFALDNAAKIFPAIITENVTSVLRITAVLKHAVRIKSFRKAVLLVEKRFPFFRVQLKEGFFWYYLEHLPKHIPIETDDKPICRKFQKGDLLIRFSLKNTNISLECSHILTDGSGAFEFLKNVLILYSAECGKQL